MLCLPLSVFAQQLTSYTNKVTNGYNFWIYTPEGYDTTSADKPIVLFLHGQSLCGSDLNRVRRYGPLDALKMGRKIDAVVVAPQNPGGSWNPAKIMNVLEWVEARYPVDTNRLYVLGMSLGGYGTLDFVGTYPEKVAAAMALCGGCTLKDQSKMGDVPLWILHGTADKAVSVRESQTVVNRMKQAGNALRLRYDWLPGATHGALARYFYTSKTYEWLFSHSLRDPDRPVNRSIDICQNELKQAYRYMEKRLEQLEEE